MSDFDLAIIPAAAATEGYTEVDPVELAKAPTGRVFRKHLLNLGELNYEGKVYKLDDDWYTRLKGNFDSGVSIVQVPLADAANRHSEDPMRNAGEVIDIQRDGDKVYSVLDIRDPKVADKIANKTILGASALLHMNYKDTATQQRIGPALLHHCLTNRPYVTGLDDYEEVLAATADSAADMELGENPVILALPEDRMPTKEEMLAALKAEHGIDVEALQAAADAKPDMAAFTAAVTDALKDSGAVQLSATDGDLSQTDVVGAIVELARKNETLTESVASLQRKDAENEVDGYISTGRVLPKQRKAFIKLALDDREMLDDMLPAEPVVKLNHQEGIGGPDGEQKHRENIDEEIDRLSAVSEQVAAHNGAGKAKK